MLAFERLLRHRRGLLAGYGLLVLAAAPGLLLLEVDNSPEGFLTRDARALRQHETLERSFGRDRGVRLVLSGEGLWTARGLAWLDSLEERAEEPGGVYGAAGPAGHHRWHLERRPAEDPAAFARLVQTDPLDRQAGWVSADGRTVTVLAGLYEMAPARRAATLEALEAALGDAPAGVEAGLVGIPVINRALDASIVDLAARFFPLLLLAGVALLGWFFRSVSGVAIPLALVGASEIVLLGVMGYAGQRLDVVTILLVPLVFVIALATAVHVMAFHRTRREPDPVARVAATYREKAWAVLWAGLTTAAGFGSLATSGVPAVQSLGAWAAFGIVFLTVAALSLYPALLVACPDAGAAGRGNPAGRLGRWARRGARWSADRRRTVMLAFAVAAVLAGVGLFRLGVGSNVLTYFQSDHPVRAAIERLEAQGIGAVGASLVLERERGFRTDADLAALRRLAAELRGDPLVLGVVGLGDLAANVERYRGAREPDVLAFMGERQDLRRLRAFLLHREGKRTRVVLATAMRGWEELQPLYRRAEAAAGRIFPDAEAYVTGQYPLILAGQRGLLHTIVAALGLTLLVIVTILALLVRNASLAVRAVVPNLWPVLCVLGVMGWLGVPVDSATVMIASVILGLAVDDTLHVLTHYRRLEPAHGPKEAIVETLGRAGAGLVVTSIILALGFATVSQSSLVPVAHFGMVASLAVACALAADLWLVPALFASARPSRAAGGPARSQETSRRSRSQ